jgi:peptidoglycan L-alanyl-D-glutamate endopeptidase CwlK
MYDAGASDKWTGWAAFKSAVAAKMNASEEEAEVVADKRVKVNVVANGKKIADGYAEDGVTYVPVRSVAETLGARVTWDSATNTVTITDGK